MERRDTHTHTHHRSRPHDKDQDDAADRDKDDGHHRFERATAAANGKQQATVASMEAVNGLPPHQQQAFMKNLEEMQMKDSLT